MADRADEEPEEGFTIRDRRRFTGDSGSDAGSPPATSTTTSTTVSTTASSIATESSAPSPSLMMTEEISPGEADFDEAMAEMGDMMGEEDEASLPDIYSVLSLFLGELRNLAWLRMGLIANPGTGKIERDLAQARIAIDTVDFLAKQLEGVVAPEERLPLRSLVSDLQVNFVEQSKRGA